MSTIEQISCLSCGSCADRVWQEVTRQPVDIVYYLLRGDGKAKIGQTSQFASRIQALTGKYGTLVLLAAEPGDRRKEQEMHRRFAHLRATPTGEWFKVDAALSRHIESIAVTGRYPISFGDVSYNELVAMTNQAHRATS